MSAEALLHILGAGSLEELEAWQRQVLNNYLQTAPEDRRKHRGYYASKLTKLVTQVDVEIKRYSKEQRYPDVQVLQTITQNLDKTGQELRYICDILIADTPLSKQKEADFASDLTYWVGGYQEKWVNALAAVQQAIDNVNANRPPPVKPPVIMTPAPSPPPDRRGNPLQPAPGAAATGVPPPGAAALTTVVTATSTATSAVVTAPTGGTNQQPQQPQQPGPAPIPPQGTGVIPRGTLAPPSGNPGTSNPVNDPSQRQQQNFSFGNFSQDEMNAMMAGSSHGQVQLMNMFSRSLASTFSITNVVSKKFDGDPEQFGEFELLWKKADKQMVALHFSKAARYWELKKCLSGAALAYVSSLPPAEDASYDMAWKVLCDMFKEQRTTLKHITRNLLQMPVCGSSYKERQKMHAQIVAYHHAVLATGASVQDVLLAFELCIIESRLDNELRKDWFRFCAKKKDHTVPLGIRVTFQDLIEQLRQFITQQLRFQNSQEISTAPAAGANQNGGANKKGKAMAIPAGTPRATSQSDQQSRKRDSSSSNKKEREKRQATIEVPCPFCKDTSKQGQKHVHGFPMNCPVFKEWDPTKARKEVNERNLCHNCLGNHKVANCDAPSFIRCRTAGCNKRHHRVFHDANNKA